MSEHPRVARVRAVFEDWAARGRAEDMASSHEPFVRPVFARLPLGPRSWYLDIGCGNGYTVRWAAAIAREGRAIGLDAAEGMVARARGLSASFPNAEFHVAAFPDRHTLPPDRFDVIYSMEVFYYLPDLVRALAEVRRLLAPGGVFACQVDFYEENVASHSWPADVGVEMTLLSESGWRAAFEAGGLEVTEQFRVRLPRDEAAETWRATEGSLATIGRRP